MMGMAKNFMHMTRSSQELNDKKTIITESSSPRLNTQENASTFIHHVYCKRFSYPITPTDFLVRSVRIVEVGSAYGTGV